MNAATAAYCEIAGGQTVTVAAPLDKIPLFRRAGSLIPLAEPGVRLTPASFSRLTLLAESSFTSGRGLDEAVEVSGGTVAIH